MDIPAQYQLMGQTIMVRVIEPDEWDDTSCWGQFNPATNEIRLLRRSPEATAQTFCHEMVHTILTAMSHKLNKDEVFVDLVGSLLHQILTTAK